MAAIGRFQKGNEIFHAKVVDGELFRLRGDVFGSPSFDRKPTPRKGVKTLVPVVPSKVIAVGLNYIEHARETGKPLPRTPLFWLKATTSLLPDGGKIEIPFPHHRTDYEAELAIVIGRKIRNVTSTSASRYIFGYTTAQDISDRTIQNAESQWARCKSFDTFTPLGPFVETQTGSGRSDDSTFSKWPSAPELEHEPAHLQTRRTRQLHLHEPDAAARRRDSDRHAQRHWPDSKRRPAGSADSGTRAAGKHSEITLTQRRKGAEGKQDFSLRLCVSALKFSHALDQNVDSDAP